MLVIWHLCGTFIRNLVLPFDVASWQRLVWNWSSFLIRRWYSVQDSQPNNRTDRTATLYTVTFVSSHIPWSLQSLWESTKPGDGLCYLRADVYVGINVGGQHAAEITEVFNSLQNNIVDFDSRRWGHGLSDWLVHHLCLLQTMTKTKTSGSSSETVKELLGITQSVGKECTVISIQEIVNYRCNSPSVHLKPSQVKYASICSRLNQNAQITLLEGYQ